MCEFKFCYSTLFHANVLKNLQVSEYMFKRNRLISMAALLYLGQLLTLMMVAYSTSRFCFYLYNKSGWGEQSAAVVSKAFIHGLRFDLSALMMINALLILVLLLTSYFFEFKSRHMKIIGGLFWLFNLPMLVTNFADIIYYPFSGRRSGVEIFDYMNDFSAQSGQLVQQYSWMVLAFIIAIVLVIRYFKPKFVPIFFTRIQYLFVILISLTLVVGGIRGGLQRMPLSVYHSMSWSSSELTDLVLNTPFTLVRKKTSDLQRKNWFTSHKEAFDIAQPTSFQLTQNSRKKQNVVVIILESFGLEYVKDLPERKSYTPFLRSLAEKGLYFENGFANGRVSIDSVPSILVGVPALMDRTFVRSPYNLNELYPLPKILHEYGYNNMFFHGATNGSMYFDVMAEQFGFDEYYGRDEYNDDSDFDGKWGIFDEPFLQFTAQKLNQAAQPFFSTIFTLSSHNPYTLPKQYEDVIEDGQIPMHRVVRYSDLALQKFFEQAKQMPWFENTLFVITADHTSDNVEKSFSSKIGKHRIPIILYSPSGLVPQKESKKIVQQLDIPVTILDYLGIAEQEIDKLSPFGRSMLNDDAPGKALFYEDGLYWLLSGNSYTTLDQQGLRAATKVLDEPFFDVRNSSTSPQADLQQLKANLQLYNNGLIDDKLYLNR
jgi:phosphoglycerol transferase MdoB-like AlkP superfamily enzyme